MKDLSRRLKLIEEALGSREKAHYYVVAVSILPDEEIRKYGAGKIKESDMKPEKTEIIAIWLIRGKRWIWRVPIEEWKKTEPERYKRIMVGEDG